MSHKEVHPREEAAIRRFLGVHALVEAERRMVFALDMAGLANAAREAREVLRVLEDVREVCRQAVEFARDERGADQSE